MIQITKTRDIKDLNSFQALVKSNISKIDYVMKFSQSDLVFNMSEELSAEENSLLDELVLNFEDVDPYLKIPKIYDYVKYDVRHKHFHNIDYKKELTISLIPKRTIAQGEVTRVDWYRSLDESMNPVDLILRVEVVYNRDSTGFATSRSTNRVWINRDGSDNENIKITAKYYFINPSDMIDEGLRRRKLLVNSIQIPTLTFMTEVLMPLGYNQQSIVLKGRAFMDDYEQYFSNFVENSSTITNPASPDAGMKSIVVRFRDENNNEYTEWLDKAPASLGGMTTIRQYLISEFSI